MYALMIDLESGSSSKRPITGWHNRPSEIDTTQNHIIERDGESTEVSDIGLPWEQRYYNQDNGNIFTEQVREPNERDIQDFDLTVDKDTITGNGTDTATITATVEPPELGNYIDAYFRVEGSTQASNSITNGETVFEFASESTGAFQLEVDIGGLQSKKEYVEVT